MQEYKCNLVKKRYLKILVIGVNIDTKELLLALEDIDEKNNWCEDYRWAIKGEYVLENKYIKIKSVLVVDCAYDSNRNL